MPVKKYSLELLKKVGALSDDGILVYDLVNGSVLFCNKAFAKILELPVSDIIHGAYSAIRKALKDEPGFLAAVFEEFKAASKISNVELRIVSAHAKYASVDAYRVEDGDVVVVFVKDITRSKEHLNYIVEFGARKDTILDAISQNLSARLNMITNLMDVMDQVSTAQQYRKIEQPARLIRENTQYCIDLIHTFLREEHLASPMIPLEANRFDVMAKVRIVASRFAEFNPTKQISVLGPKKEIFMTGDDVKFFQIVHNLVSNAIKYTDERGQVVLKVSERDSSVVVSVKDNGIGIPEYLKPHLFRKDTPAARPGLRGEKSTGLGLYIIKKLLNLMDGSITVSSVEGEGSTFTIEVPGISG